MTIKTPVIDHMPRALEWFDDYRRGCKQQYGSAEDGYSERGIEQQPADQDRHNRNGRRGDLDAKHVDGPCAERENRGQEQK